MMAYSADLRVNQLTQQLLVQVTCLMHPSISLTGAQSLSIMTSKLDVFEM